MEGKAEDNCLAHALVTAIAKVDKDPNFDVFRKGRKMRHVVQTLLETTSLSNGARIPEVVRFRDKFREDKRVVYHGLNCNKILCEGQVDSIKRFDILYDEVERHYHVIINFTVALARTYVFKCCNKACTSDITHVCDETYSDCMASPPCAFCDVRFPASNAIDTFEFAHISPATSGALKRNVMCTNENGTARRVDGS